MRAELEDLASKIEDAALDLECASREFSGRRQMESEYSLLECLPPLIWFRDHSPGK